MSSQRKFTFKEKPNGGQMQNKTKLSKLERNIKFLRKKRKNLNCLKL